jgi:hypothetical protein
MLTIDYKKLIKLVVTLISAASFIELNATSSMAELGDCQFSVGENYVNSVQGRRARSILTINNSKNATSNEGSVNIFSGSWRLERVSASKPVTIQTAGSMFLMIIDMGEIKEVWVGKCMSNGIVKGTIWDPNFSGITPSFVIESQ